MFAWEDSSFGLIGKAPVGSHLGAIPRTDLQEADGTMVLLTKAAATNTVVVSAQRPQSGVMPAGCTPILEAGRV